MKFFTKMKDGGEESFVTGYFLCEIKRLFSIAILRFDNSGREIYHNHAFNSISWVLSGFIIESFVKGGQKGHSPSLFPIMTYRNTFHQVESFGTTWILTFRGPWSETWKEYDKNSLKLTTLKEHREVIDEQQIT